jgi:GNAT superfamily N-acetyltransferase
VSRRVANLTLDNLSDLPVRCRTCVFWELDPVAGQAAAEAGDLALEKEAWLSATLLDWGSCGKIVYVDSLPAGYLTYAPPTHVPRSLAFPTSPVSGDAVLLMTGTVQPEFAGTGLGRMLVQTAAKDLTRRGVRAIEAFGRIDRRDPDAGDPVVPDQVEGGAGTGRFEHGRFADDRLEHGGTTRSTCVIPADFLLAVGFKTVRPHHRFPRLRLDLRTAVSWRADVEVALERLLGSMSPEPAFRPV